MSAGSRSENNEAPKVASIDIHFADAVSEVCSLPEGKANVWYQLLIALSYFQRQGHSCVVLAELANTQVLSPSVENKTNEAKLSETFPSLSVLQQVSQLATSDPRLTPLLKFDGKRLYTQRYWQFEQEVASYISANTQPQPLSDNQINALAKCWPAMFPVEEVNEQDWQQVAVAKSVTQKFSVINGGPGTGKTYTVTRLLLALQSINGSPKNIVLAAPTGKAQQRMTESISKSLSALENKIPDALKDSIPTQASTIHSLLGVREHTIDTRYSNHQKLSLDVLIVDEASMIDLALMARLMRAMPEHGRLYLIGDADQLPAVETGNVLEQLAIDDNVTGAAPSPLVNWVGQLCPHLPKLPVNENAQPWLHTLVAAQRFKGALAALATEIQQGNDDAASALLNNIESPRLTLPGDSVFMANDIDVDIERLQGVARESFQPLRSAKNPQEALDVLAQVRWLTPIRKGTLGVEGLNRLIERSLSVNSRTPENGFYRGRPIMVTKNNHAQRLSNGEVGVIWPDKTGVLKAWFEGDDGGLRSVSLARLPNVETVYAMTIHKSQGSEFEQVVMFLPELADEVASSVGHRGILYTGLTRAKRGCLIISQLHTFKRMVSTKAQRFSGLSDAICESHT
ncbi:exodeoxyribonuclease V subunit alpha [Alteromonas sp. KUL49]|uniref:exodeoxyribonuclease V subunit alpha n=1 Tax=Alteromonas sp. KUL49 TaxID=2480798 RepID=UPI00102EE905|nr:exodeoxyribonuclease V subunit alpha [Alteromonas sp. KUL49]TAP37368.1 exodeoxyribonuclease V subunit alpha [Alteromonas sp. KUL49]GEA13002.1 RecBCD enzyme subunit RecD [Alteromonas sp. KUL49]